MLIQTIDSIENWPRLADAPESVAHSSNPIKKFFFSFRSSKLNRDEIDRNLTVSQLFLRHTIPIHLWCFVIMFICFALYTQNTWKMLPCTKIWWNFHRMRTWMAQRLPLYAYKIHTILIRLVWHVENWTAFSIGECNNINWQSKRRIDLEWGIRCVMRSSARCSAHAIGGFRWRQS